MKKIAIIIILLIIIPVTSFARDYVIDFISENYKEETEDYKHHLQIFHSIQINSIAGQKVLILNGDNYQYRKWLRQYISKSKKLIIKIPDDDNSNFISSKAYTIDITSLYPINEANWKADDPLARLKVIQGTRHILILDKNIKRKKLIEQIVQDLGLPMTSLSDSGEALRIFQVQPDSFYMVIANYDSKSFKQTKFIENLANISPETPVILGGVYNNKKINEKLSNDFSRMDNVLVRPMILEELTKVIIQLL